MDWPALNVSTGPGEVGDWTLRAAARPPLSHHDPAFVELFARTAELLRRVYRTEYDVVMLQGEAVLALEAAAASLVAPGDRVLNLVSGSYGAWYAGYIRRAGGEVVELRVPYNEAIDPEDVRRALRDDPRIRYLAVVHVETPSGTVNPVREIGRVARERGVLTIVDTVSGLGGTLLSPEEWGIDVAISAPQKCLGGLPGLALLSVSPAAWAAMERHPAPVRGSYLSLLDWKDAWLAERRFPHTPSVSLVYALEATLGRALDVGIERLAARHAVVARACRAGVRALELRTWPARDEIAATAVTAVAVPEGLSDAQLRGHLRERYGVMMSGASGDLAGKVFLLGHMGETARPSVLAAELAMLERTLADLGHPVALGTGVGAALAELAGWGEGGA
jgi:pyridoxamine--pyruvate transaminase